MGYVLAEAGFGDKKGGEVMERLIMLGTGSALVTECYNTCFAIEKDEEYLLVNTGGGNGILRQLEKARIDYTHIHHIFLTNERTEHILGLVWLLRVIGKAIREENYDGELYIYASSDVTDKMRALSALTLPKKYTWLFDHRIMFVPLYDGDRMQIMGYPTTFFDIASKHTKQYGFVMELQSGKHLTYGGDEPLSEENFGYAQGVDWLIHEAYCLHSQREVYDPYAKNHGTVKEACELAAYLNIPNLILCHTEDDNIQRRKKLYMAEGRLYYYGNLCIPDDLESIEL